MTPCSPPGSSVHGISQARILEWVAISFSRGFSQPRDQSYISCLTDGLFTTEPPGKPGLVSNSPLSITTLSYTGVQINLCWINHLYIAGPWDSLKFFFNYSTLITGSVVSNSLQPHWLAHQVLLSMGFSRQEFWNGLPFSSLGIEPGSLHWRQILYHLSYQGSPDYSTMDNIQFLKKVSITTVTWKENCSWPFRAEWHWEGLQWRRKQEGPQCIGLECRSKNKARMPTVQTLWPSSPRLPTLISSRSTISSCKLLNFSQSHFIHL